MAIAVSAATVHGAWFASADATTEGAPAASIRMAEWDHYEQKWVATIIGDGETLRHSEGAIFELRSQGGGAVSLSNVPTGLTIETLAAQDLDALDIPLPGASNLVAFAPLTTVPVATGAPTYIRLAVSALSVEPAHAADSLQTRPPGHVGVWTGPLTPTDTDRAALDINGSVGEHPAVALTDGADTVTFTWDIGRWSKGDLFIGMNQFTYRVLDRTGEFKRFVASADIDHPDASLAYNITAGCAANWKTGEVYATNFADFDPAVNVITRHPSSVGRSLYSPADRRILTTTAYDHPDAALPVDINPESVVFDAQMNMYVGHSDSFLGPVTTNVFDALTLNHPTLYDDPADWYFLDITGRPLSYSDGNSYPVVVDETGGVLVVGPNGVGPFVSRPYGFDVATRLKYSGNNLIFSPLASIASLGVPALMPETYMADPVTGQPLMVQGGSEIPGRWPMGRRIHRYNVQPDGSYLGADTSDPGGPDRDLFWAVTSRVGTDWIDLDVTGDVVYYTSEDSLIHRYRVRPGINNDPVGQLPDVGLGQLIPGESVRFNAMRILPPGDGSGGFLTAADKAIYRFAQNGAFVQQYQVHNDPYLKGQYAEGTPEWDNAGLVTTWYAMEIDPNGRTFWASSNDSGWIYQFDIASGRELNRIEAVEYLDVDVDPNLPEGRVIGALCVMWEYTAPQEVCFAADGSPDGNDDDGDGFIDENCKAIEVCNNVVDDDGDLLPDNNDPDCGTEEPPVAEPDFYVTDQNVNLSVPSVGTLVVLNNDTDPDNGVVGEPWRADTLLVAAYGAATPDLAPGTPLVTAFGTVTLAADGSFLFDPAATFHGQFTFVYRVTDGVSTSAPTTVTIDVRPLVANDNYATTKNTPLTGTTVLANDSIAPMVVSAAGPDTITSLTGPSITFQTTNGGTVVLNADGTFVYTPATGFIGDDTFVYLGYDGNSDSVSTATVTIAVSDVNAVLAADDGYTTAYFTATTRNLFVNDSDPQGDVFVLTHVNGQPVTVGSVVTLALPDNKTATILVNTLAGSVTITPPENFWGTFTFPYTIQDDAPTPATATADVTVFVSEPGTVAVANDAYTTQQNTPISVPGASGVLANDTNVGLPVFWLGGAGPHVPLNGAPVTGPTSLGGTVTLFPDGSLVYTPALNFVGQEVFLYGVRRWDGTDFRANVTLTVLPVSSAVTVTTPDPSIYGAAADVTATVTCGASQAPSVGTVTFLRGTTVIAANVPVVNGVARAQLAASLPVGNHVIVAQYSGVPAANVTEGCPAASGSDTHRVIPAPLTITARAQSKPYGTVFTFTGTQFDVSGLLFAADTVTSVTLVSPAGAPAAASVVGAPYPITPSNAQGTGLANYEITYLPGPLTVTRVPLTVQAHDKTRVEGQPNPTLDGVWTGFVNGDSVLAVYTTSALTGSPAGNYPITPTPSDPNNILSNYILAIVPGTLEVRPFVNAPPVAANDSRTTSGTAPVSITVLDNDSDPNGHPLTVVPTGFTQPANGTVTLTGNTFTFVATAGFTGTTTFTYTISDGNGGTAVATVTVLVTATTCSTTGYLTYSQGGWGSNPSGNNPGAFLAAKFATVYPGGSVQIGGIKKLTFTSAAAIAAFLPQGGSSNVLTSNATNPTSSSAGNFAAQLLAMRLAVDFSAAGVTKAGMGALVMQSGPLAGMTVDAILAMANTVIGGTTSALPSGMSMSTLSGILESLNMNFHEGTVNQGLLGCGGTTPCSATQLAFTGNSSVSGTAGNIRTFSAGGVSVNASAFSRVKGSGGSWAAAYLGVWSPGLGVTDTSENGASNTHTLDNSGRLNYILFEFSQPVIVTKAFLDSIGGDSDATFWVGTLVNPFTSHVTLSDAVLAGLGAGQASAGGSSARWASLNASKVSGNVIVIAASTTESDDAFKVSKLQLECGSTPEEPNEPVAPTIAATGGAFVYSGAPHTATCTVTGANNLALTGTLSYSPGSSAPSQVGTYTATCAFAGNASYSAATANATMTVTPRPATVSAGSGSKVYGTSADPALTSVGTNGFLSGDLSSIGLSQARAAGQTVGSFPTTAVATGAVLSNYSVTYVPGTFSITPASLTVVANPKTKTQGAANPALDGTLTGVVAGDTITATYSTSATTSSPVGTYAIVPTLVDGGNKLSNYAVTKTNGTLTVTASTPTCSVSQFSLTGSSSTFGTAGNIRTFTSGSVSVKARAFSRTKGSSGTWSTAFLGAWSEGLGVTDGAEGTGGNNTHKVDNVDRLNYVMFEFSQPVVVTRAYLNSISTDSDATIWVGTANNPYSNHVTLSDAVLTNLGSAQSSAGSSSARWASFNGSAVTANVVVIAADVNGTNDEFKVNMLDVACSGGSPAPSAPTGTSDAYSVVKKKTLTVSASDGVLDNDNANGGQAVLVSGPSQGDLTFNSNGSFTYKADSSTGTVTFSYKIVANGRESSAITVTLSVTSK